jgi:hypothetical protein
MPLDIRSIFVLLPGFVCATWQPILNWAEQYSRIKPGEVDFKIPALASGEYYFFVKTIPKEGKDIQTGKLKSVLNVI